MTPLDKDALTHQETLDGGGKTIEGWTRQGIDRAIEAAKELGAPPLDDRYLNMLWYHVSDAISHAIHDRDLLAGASEIVRGEPRPCVCGHGAPRHQVDHTGACVGACLECQCNSLRNTDADYVAKVEARP